MSWDTDEASIESGDPREALEIKHGSTVYRIAMCSRDLVIGGNLYKAGAGGRSAIGPTSTGASDDVEIRLPSNHPFAQRYLPGRLPRVVTVSIYRLQQNSGDVERIWFGRIIGAKAREHVVSFKAQSRMIDIDVRQIPVFGVGRACPYTLFGAGCRKSRTGFSVATTVAGYGGTSLTLASIGGKPDHWAQFGELVHLPSGERFPVIDQVGTLITLQEQIFGVQVDQAVQLFAGCAKDVGTCETKFDNRQNFGGEPDLPRGNVFLPSGHGIFQIGPKTGEIESE